MKYYKPLMLVVMFAIATFYINDRAVAQSIYFSPDTVKVCSGESEEFDVELWADHMVQGLNAYTAFISFDNEFLELYNLFDTTYWECLIWTKDSLCIDSIGIAWELDSICIDWDCVTWQIVDSVCLDSFPIWDLDSICNSWFVEWEVDSTCLDSTESWELDSLFLGWDCTLWQVDSTCLDSIPEWTLDSVCLTWECIEWDEFLNCIDSACIEWEIDSTITSWLCIAWDLDSTCIDSVENWYVDSLFAGWECLTWDLDSILVDSMCMDWHIDSAFIGWGCSDWDVDSTCVDSMCVEWQVDSTTIAWECTAWYVDSTCSDSAETTFELADFFTLDTTLYAITEGPLLYSPDAQSVLFFSRLTEDTTTLIIESILFWPRIDVDGPGLLATLHLRNLANGIVNFSIDSITVLDVDGNVLPVSGEGNVLMLNAPSESYNLLLPENGNSMQISPGDSVEFSWEDSKPICEGDVVLYDLIVSESELFPGIITTTFPDINGTSFRLDGTMDLWDGDVYWKVLAHTSYGAEQYCNQEYYLLKVDILATPPGNFSLLIPTDDSLLNTSGNVEEYFQWTEAGATLPNDTLSYDLYIWLETPIPGEEDMIFVDIMGLETTVPCDTFLLYEQYNWNVKCINRIGLFTWSDELCKMVFYLRGDVNADGVVNVGDPVYLINYIFKSGPGPLYNLMGDANCDTAVDVGDAVFLINYVFKDGPAPCSD